MQAHAVREQLISEEIKDSLEEMAFEEDHQ